MAPPLPVHRRVLRATATTAKGGSPATHSRQAVLKHIETWLDGSRTWLVYLPADRRGAAGLKHQKGLD